MFLNEFAEFKQKKDEKEKYVARRKGIYSDPILSSGVGLGAGALVGSSLAQIIGGKKLVQRAKQIRLKHPHAGSSPAFVRYQTRLIKKLDKTSKLGAVGGGLVGAGLVYGVAKLANKINKQDKRKVTRKDRIKSLATVGLLGGGGYLLRNKIAKLAIKNSPTLQRTLGKIDDNVEYLSEGVLKRRKARVKDARQDFSNKARELKSQFERQPRPNNDLPRLSGTTFDKVPKQKRTMTENDIKNELTDWSNKRYNKIVNQQKREYNNLNNYANQNRKLIANSLKLTAVGGALTAGGQLALNYDRYRKLKEDDRNAIINKKVGNVRFII